MEHPSAEDMLNYMIKEVALSTDDEGRMCYRIEFPTGVSWAAYTFNDKPLPSFEEALLRDMMETK